MRISFVNTLLKVFSLTHRGVNGPVALTRTYIQECRQDMINLDLIHSGVYAHDDDGTFVMNTEPFDANPAVCDGLIVAGRDRFYSIHYLETYVLLKDWTSECGLLSHIFKNSLALHFWSKMMGQLEMTDTTSFLSKIMQRQCPATFKLHH